MLPQHVAIIMDGNGRWAAQRDLPRSAGHQAGGEAVRLAVTHCRELGIPYLTLYAFSQENWRRPASEVKFLFDLLVKFLKNELNLLQEQNIRLNILGDAEKLPLLARQSLNRVVRQTRNNTAMTLNLALNYSGREEIALACRRALADNIPAEELTPETLARYLYTAGQPDPDLIIRTSGELRLSNFLLFQAAYSELYVTSVLWPDFTVADFDLALKDFAARERRFGTTGGHAAP